jgi:hypothetical protein
MTAELRCPHRRDRKAFSMSNRERILITVRTYPTISENNVETVCTGGITADQQWRRLYPISLRYLSDEQQYTTYDIVEVDVKPGNDGRIETRKPHTPSLKIVGHIDDWGQRCEWINPTIFPAMKVMIEAKATLAPVAVRQVLDFIVEDSSTEWSAKQLEKLKQEQMFEKRKDLEKVPYDFFLRWKDGNGDEFKSRVLAWEMLQTWRNFSSQYADPLDRMRDKWMTDVCDTSRRSLSFFMGNYHNHRQWFSVTGIFNPPKKDAAFDSLWAIGKR